MKKLFVAIVAVASGAACKGDAPVTGATASGGSSPAEAAAAAGVPGGIAKASKPFSAKPGCDSALSGALEVREVTFTRACSPYRVNGQYQIDRDAVVTIEPGVEIQFEEASGLAVAPNGKARLLARGSAERPIRFTSATASPAAGDWDGITFFAGAAGSVLEHVVVEHAGRARTRGMVHTLAPIRVADSVLRLGAGHGLSTDEGGRAEFTGNRVEEVAGDAARITVRALGGIGAGNQWPADKTIVVAGGAIDAPTVVAAQSIPYRIEGGPIEVDGAEGAPVVLTLQPGVTFQFASEAGGIEVGTRGRAKLLSEGGAEDPVLLTSAGEEPGGWSGVAVGDHGEAKIARTVFELAGAGEGSGAGALFVAPRARVAVVDSEFLQSDAAGVVSAAPFLEFRGNRFAGNNGPDVRVLLPVVGSLGEGNRFDDEAAIEVRGGSIVGEATWRAFTAPYRIAEKTLEVGDGSRSGKLTIEPGATLVFERGLGLAVGRGAKPGTLVATGVAGAPITFTGAAAEKGSWSGILLGDRSTGSVLDHVVVAWAGEPQRDDSAAVTVGSQAQARIGTAKFAHGNHGVRACKARKLTVDPKKLSAEDVKTTFRKDC